MLAIRRKHKKNYGLNNISKMEDQELEALRAQRMAEMQAKAVSIVT